MQSEHVSQGICGQRRTRSARGRGYKTFFMLNSTEHEIFHANKSQITNTMPNSFLLNIAEDENFSANKYENANYCWHFHIY